MKKVVTFNADKPTDQKVSLLPYLTKVTSVVVQGFNTNGEPVSGDSSLSTLINLQPYYVGDQVGDVIGRAQLDTVDNRVNVWLNSPFDAMAVALDSGALSSDFSKIEVTIYQV